MITHRVPGPSATTSTVDADLVDAAARDESEADHLYDAACYAADRGDHREAGQMLARHMRRLRRARSFARNA